MIERIGDIVEIGNAQNVIIALRGIITIVDTGEQKFEPGSLSGRIEPCTAIIIEGGQQINISREEGTFVRGCLKDYAREQAAQRTLR